MADRHILDITAAISEIEKKQQEGVSALEAITIGSARAFSASGAAIVSLTSVRKDFRILAHCSHQDMFSASDDLASILETAYKTRSSVKSNLWQSQTQPIGCKQKIVFFGRLVFDTSKLPVGFLVLWTNRHIEFDDATTNFLSLIGLSIDAYFEKQGQYHGTLALSDAFEAISDGIILYDQDYRVAAFNGRQQELFPSFAEHLKIGVPYEDLLRKQVEAGQIRSAIGREEEWIKERKTLLKQHRYSTEQEFESGRTMRLTNYQTKSGGSVAVRTDITELVQARRESATNEKQIRDILELSPDAIIVQSEGVPVYINQRAVEIFGANSAEEMLTRKGLDFAHPDERETILAYRNLVISGEIPFQKFETRHLKMDGTPFHTEMNMGQVSWKDRPGTVNIIRDITTRKQAEAAILRQEEEMILAQKLARVGHWRLTPATNKLEWSDELYRIYGLDRATTELTVDLAHSMKPVADAEYFGKMVSGFDKGEAATDFDYQIIRKDGEIRNLRGSIRPTVDEEGNVISVFGVSQDVTEQKEIERARDASNTRFKDLAELGADWFWEMDAELRFSYFSDRLHRITGVNTDLYIGQTRQEIANGALIGEHWKQHLADLDQHRPFKNFRYAHKNASGQLFHWTISGKPIFDCDGNFAGYRGSGTDITSQTVMEEKLTQSQKMEAVGQLTGGVAHDFNNLLGVIQGNTELILETASHLSEKEKVFLQAVMKSTERGAELTQSMLAFSRKQALVPKTIYLDEQIRGMTKILDRTLGEEITIKVNHEVNLWACTADPGQVENALLNLSLNARDAMPNGGILSIETRNILLDDEYTEVQTGLKPGKYLLLSISDSGTGISQEDLDRVFEPFFTTKEVGKGTGLGLSMVYGFAKQSGGHASIYSELGIGTTVKIYLPQTEHVTKDKKKTDRIETTSNGEVILVVEDDPDMRSLTVALLSNMGFSVKSAENGPAAFEALATIDQLDILLTDVVLPGGMNGVELADQIADMDPSVKTLFMSGYTEDAFTQNGLLKSNSILLQKPFRRADLSKKIQQVLRKNT